MNVIELLYVKYVFALLLSRLSLLNEQWLCSNYGRIFIDLLYLLT